MPAERKHISDLASFRYTPVKVVRSTKVNICPQVRNVESQAMTASSPLESESKRHGDPVPNMKTDYSECDIYYPMTRSEREAFRTEAGKRVPPHHWAVYDLIRTIPAGRVTMYKDVCAALGQGSPRSVGGALRNNPFAPRIPCHRVIASSLFVGGFKGEWGAASVVREHSDEEEDGTTFRNWHKPFRGGGMGPLQNEKLRMLVREGVGFGKGGKMMISGDDVLWQFDAVNE